MRSLQHSSRGIVDAFDTFQLYTSYVEEIFGHIMAVFHGQVIMHSLRTVEGLQGKSGSQWSKATNI